MTDRAGDAQEGREDGREFFVPELCTARALFVLVLVGELLVVVLVLAGGPLSWERFGLTSLFVQWVVLASAGVLCLARGWLTRYTLEQGVFLSFAMVLTVTLLLTLLVGQLTPEATSLAAMELVLRNMVISSIVTGLVLRYFYVQQRLHSHEKTELHSRIQALQSRIRPHFLFNSMNIIASLISVDPETAETVVEDLSELFRASLNDAGNQVMLSDEIALCERYCRIEGLRLGERLAVEWDIDGLPPRVQIPLLTIQPLLENAIYHGIQPLPEGGTISVLIRYEGGDVRIRISNPVPGPEYRDHAHGQGNRMALANIRSRLAVLHGNAAGLDAEVRDGAYVTELHYPFEVAEEAA